MHCSSRAFDNTEPKHKHLKIPIKNLYNEKCLAANPVRVILVEGVFDCLSMISFGFTNTVATFGTVGFKKQYCELFHKNTEIDIIFDNDENGSGMKGAVKVALILYENNFKNVNIVNLKKDIDDKKADCNSVLTSKNGYFKMLRSIASKMPILSCPAFLESLDILKSRRSPKRPSKEDFFDLNMRDLAIGHTRIIRKHGDRMMAFCPFHDDSTASLVIYLNSNSFYCFGCNRGGGPPTFARLLKDAGINIREDMKNEARFF